MQIYSRWTEGEDLSHYRYYFYLYHFIFLNINYVLWWNSNNATLQTLLNSSDPYRSHYCVCSDKKKVPPRSGCVLVVMYRRPWDPKTLTLFYTDPYMALPPGLKTDLYYTPTGVGKSVHLFVVIDRERHPQTN